MVYQNTFKFILLLIVLIGLQDLAQAQTEPKPVLLVYNVQSRFSKSGEYVYVEGMVENISNKPLKGLECVVMIVNVQGKLVTGNDAFTTINPLQPGKASPFRVILDNIWEGEYYKVDFQEYLKGAIPWKSKGKLFNRDFTTATLQAVGR